MSNIFDPNRKLKFLRKNLRNTVTMLEAMSRPLSGQSERKAENLPIILVLGAHRSGTSFLTQIMSVLGFDLGKTLMLPSYDNPRGFWENELIVGIHDGIFRAFGKDWTTAPAMDEDWLNSDAARDAAYSILEIIEADFNGRNPVLIKDPRLSVLHPLWDRIAEQLNRPLIKVTILRSPESIAASVRRRNGMDVGDARLMTLQYLRHASESLDKNSDMLIYEHLVKMDGGTLYNTIVETLGMEIGNRNPNIINQIERIKGVNLNHQSFNSKIQKSYLELIDIESPQISVADVIPYLKDCLDIPNLVNRQKNHANKSSLLPIEEKAVTVAIPEIQYQALIQDSVKNSNLQDKLIGLEERLERGDKEKPKVAVITSDLGQEAAERAANLCDILDRDWTVELVGPLWDETGGKILPSIANSDRVTRSFNCVSLKDFYPIIQAFAETNNYDMVVVCNPRAPSLALGGLIKKYSNCPLILDVDGIEAAADDEDIHISEADIKKNLVEAFERPYGEMATQYCRKLIGEADSLTVSNVALCKEFGGHLVRHARDEEMFNPLHYDRATARKKLGLTDKDFALMFMGSAPEYMGLSKLSEAMNEMGKKSVFTLNILGPIEDDQLRGTVDGLSNARLNFFPDPDFSELCTHLIASDAIALLMDTDSEEEKFHFPALISDGLSFGLPIITTEVPAIYDLEERKLVRVIHADYISETLEELYEKRAETGSLRIREQIRTGFEDELGFGVNRQRLRNSIARASKLSGELPEGLERLLGHLNTAYLNLSDKKSVRASGPIKNKVDMVVFGDPFATGDNTDHAKHIFDHLISQNKIGRILKFDAPIDLKSLAKALESPEKSAGTLAARAIDNKFGLNDSKRCFVRSFIWSEDFRNSSLIDGTSLDVFPAYVREQLELFSIEPERAIIWMSPTTKFGFSQIVKEFKFRNTVYEITDDNGPDEAVTSQQALEQIYQSHLPMSDVVVTGQEHNVETYLPLCGEIHWIPVTDENWTEDIAIAMADVLEASPPET